MSDKLLFLKKLPSGMKATSALLSETGFHWRTLPDEKAVMRVLQKEQIGLLLVDHRAVTGDPLAFVTSLKGIKTGTPIFLISAKALEMDKVIQATRLGVKDVFHPPLDIKVLVERMHASLQPEGGATRLEDWSEIATFMAEGAPIEPGVAPADAATRLSLVSSERDKLSAERSALQDQAAQAKARVAAVEKENARLLAEHGAMAELQEKMEIEQMKHQEELQAHLAQEQEEFEAAQLLAEQAQTKIDGVVAELQEAAEKLKMQRLQIADEHRKAGDMLNQREARVKQAEESQAAAKAKLTKDQQETEALRVKLKKEQLVIQEREAALETDATMAKNQAAQLKKSQDQVAQERTALATTKAELERDTKALREKEEQFEAKQRQIREQMKQMLA